jgi:hypothetical protein
MVPIQKIFTVLKMVLILLAESLKILPHYYTKLAESQLNMNQNIQFTTNITGTITVPFIQSKFSMLTITNFHLLTHEQSKPLVAVAVWHYTCALDNIPNTPYVGSFQDQCINISHFHNY